MATAIPSEFAQFVKDEIASGKYRSAEEVLNEALRLLQTRERKLRALQTDIQVGLEQLDRGGGPAASPGSDSGRSL